MKKIAMVILLALFIHIACDKQLTSPSNNIPIPDYEFFYVPALNFDQIIKQSCISNEKTEEIITPESVHFWSTRYYSSDDEVYIDAINRYTDGFFYDYKLITPELQMNIATLSEPINRIIPKVHWWQDKKFGISTDNGILIYDVASQSQTLIPNTENLWFEMWSDDGQKFVVKKFIDSIKPTGEVEDDKQEIYLCDLTTNRITQIGNSYYIRPHIAAFTNNIVAFLYKNEKYQIATYDVQSGNLTNIYERSDDIYSVRWQDDGSLDFISVSNNYTNVFRLYPDGKVESLATVPQFLWGEIIQSGWVLYHCQENNAIAIHLFNYQSKTDYVLTEPAPAGMHVVLKFAFIE